MVSDFIFAGPNICNRALVIEQFIVFNAIGRNNSFPPTIKD